MASRVLLLCVSVVLAAAAAAEARDFVVGGANDAWKAPAQPDALAKWASANRFQVGDKLVFKFDGAADSVLEVTRDDYNRCSTASPLAVHKATAGAATVPLPRSGPYYFVGGAPGSCQKGERLLLVVMSEKHGRGRLRGLAPAPVPAAESPFAASFVGGPAAAPAPATGAAWRTAAAGNTGALLVGAVALLGALLVEC
ncbi:early nodulin-like protein 14 [Miscanthus floridulus]|uniref:early nodulin-like protein 14 n=1 Tax=Miscanthus floridulus TaxID=154761 RepID=UPI0034599DE4